MLRIHAVETLLGLGLLYGIAAGAITLWLIPVVTGLVLAAPLSSLLAGRTGALFDRFGLLIAPEQLTTPPIVMLADKYHRQLSPSDTIVLPTDEDASALRAPDTVPSSA
jgi:membrane glycosyltransferase